MARFNGPTKKDSNMSSLVAFLFFLLMFALFCPESSAQIYKYVDKDGAVHFTNTPTDPGYKSYMGAEQRKRKLQKPEGQPKVMSPHPRKKMI